MVNISLIAYPEAPKQVFKKAETILKNRLNKLEYNITDSNPDIIFVITGGSEMKAKKLLEDLNHVLILSITESNSYAASSEIKAYCNQKGIKSVLYNLDIESNLDHKIEVYKKITDALNKIKIYKIGLIGNVSEWLINSDISKDILKEKLGLSIEKIQWNEFPEYKNYDQNKEFVDHFKKDGFDLADSSRVYNVLQKIIEQRELDAITVECFPLVQENAVTACLALSKYNSNGIPAGCEGDITSITGKIITKELTGQIPWMANLASIDHDKVFFAHCTIASNLVSDYKIRTHFETNQGTAIQGKFKFENATVFRLNNDLSKAFISYGRITERPKREDSCRTQIKIELPVSDIKKLEENPLGNHHLIIPGDHRELIQQFLQFIHIELI